MTLVWFALEKDTDYDEKCSQRLLDLFTTDLNKQVSDTTAETVNDSLSSTVEGIKQGTRSDFSYYDDIPDNIEFCLFGLVPSFVRIAVKFGYRNTFGTLRKNLEAYHKDFSIGTLAKAPPLWRIEKQLVSPKSKNEENPPDTTECFLRAILHGQPFPSKILETVVRRCKTDHDDTESHFYSLNDIRVGLIKACLNRKNKEEPLQMTLDVQNNNPAYLCGRLFATLEKIQQDASDGKLNKTIKDTYFASASATPAVVFARLFNLANNYQAKLSDGSRIFYNKLISEIVNGLDDFPKTFSLEEQATFMVGYYHQNKDFYTKKNTNEEENV